MSVRGSTQPLADYIRTALFEAARKKPIEGGMDWIAMPVGRREYSYKVTLGGA